MLNSNKRESHEMLIGGIIGAVLGFTSGHFDNIYLKSIFFLTLAIGIVVLFKKYVLKGKK